MAKNISKKNDTPNTITDDDISTSRIKERRSFLRSLGSVGLVASAMIYGTREASARDPQPRNDSDSGPDRLPDKKNPQDQD
jgi:hypothetical protein